MNKGNEMATTKFKVTITMEVKDVGNVPVDNQILTVAIKKAVEDISPDNITTFVEVRKTGRTGVKPTVSRELRELKVLGTKKLRPEEIAGR